MVRLHASNGICHLLHRGAEGLQALLVSSRSHLAQTRMLRHVCKPSCVARCGEIATTPTSTPELMRRKLLDSVRAQAWVV